ncbi:MAG: ABC-2 family transporter protein [Bdellovibrionaceae bacterium]|nr:ABC-2 family transporter protein [Pseudobdellovibrionaceae bacterium]MBX3032612.1 ABC-2 family transporter protein [Pseudobdellovibrionaceae bacterium]
MIRKYLGLYAAFFRASLIADLEYRVNFITRIVTDIFWYVAQIVTFEVLYRHTDVIGHWTLPQTRVFLGILFVIDAIYMVLFHDNLERFSDRVRKGELDLLLAKPVNSQFMVSLQRASTAILGNFALGLGWLIFSLSRLPDFSWERLLWLLILIPCGVTILYCCRFFFTSVAVIFTRAENLQFLWYQLYKFGMRPDSIYAPWLKFFLLTMLPVAMIASVPARALLDPPEPWLFLWAAVLAVFLLWVSHRFWNWCLKQYSSASS